MSEANKNTWKNRIVGEGERPAKDFNFNPLNWRTHPHLQSEAMTELLAEVGWVQRVLVNKTTGNLLDGHLRVEQALKQGENTPVPYIEVELTEGEERKILAFFDTITGMAGKDVEKFQELLDLTDFESGILDSLIQEVRHETINIEDFFEQIPEDESEKFVIEIIFDSEAEHQAALDALGKIGQTPKEALKKLLSL